MNSVKTGSLFTFPQPHGGAAESRDADGECVPVVPPQPAMTLSSPARVVEAGCWEK